MTIVLDFETRSEADLKQVGAWSYSEHPSTEIICASWAVDDGPIDNWLNPEVGTLPDRWEDIEALFKVLPGQLVEAHNTAFEVSIWENIGVKRLGWPEIPLINWRDSMALAAYYALPMALERLCVPLGLPGKDPEGGRLITKYSKLHLKTSKIEIPPEDLAKFVKYCDWDVHLERQVGNLLGLLPELEEDIWLHDFKVAHRGMRLDRSGIVGARRIVEDRAADLEDEFKEITGLKPGQRDKVLDWLADRGLEMENLQKDTIDDLLDGPDSPQGEVRKALNIRRRHARASTKKMDAMIRHCGNDGRARWQTRYHGAVTGRNTGSGFQPLNLTRGDGVDPDQMVSDINQGSAKYLDALYSDAMEAVGNASRHWITASEGSRIIAGDFASIEAIVLAFVAREEWKMQAFIDGELIYERMGEKIHGLPTGTITKKSHPLERQDGKTGELAFGYQGALGAWRNFDDSDRHTDGRVIKICRAWRDEHPMTVDLWHNLQELAFDAVRYPDKLFWDEVSGISFERVDGWLTMILLNGKRLWYWAPDIRLGMPPWHKPKEREECMEGDCECEPVPKLTYMSQKEGRWQRVHTYGGKLTENAVQAMSREILKFAELAAEKAGYPVILSVYDEVVCDVPNGYGSVEEFQEIMETRTAKWYRNWPIRGEVWEGERYRK